MSDPTMPAGLSLGVVILIHALAALPPTLMALAALIAVMKKTRRTNGHVAKLEKRIEELEHLR